MFGMKESVKAPPLVGIDTLTQRLAIAEARITALELQGDAFRDKVLRKLQKHSEVTEEIVKPSLGGRVRR